ncbi:hypothetical protein P7K49_008651 [Saguinus oedipus]|uniref:Uncharacterized protein n=1 Tax=Saguinus oedipus TaxID=9490 RepID=A0ABQ9VYW1_SAGOE|nr:hypothetical protein P7K49_008651 [Saguinus oedipus]
MPYKAAHSRNSMDRPKLFVTPPESSSRRRTIHGTALSFYLFTTKYLDKDCQKMTQGTFDLLSMYSPLSIVESVNRKDDRRWAVNSDQDENPECLYMRIKAAPPQGRPPSPGNIRPVKREGRVESEKKDPEKKDPEKEPQKVANEPSLKGIAPLVKVEATTVEEGTPAKAEAGPAGTALVEGAGPPAGTAPQTPHYR